MTISPEELAAYADGEISGERRTEVEAAIEADPSLAQQLAAHRALRASLGAHFAPLLDQSVPERLTALLSGANSLQADNNVVSLAGARERQQAKKKIPRWGWVAGPALAASLALMVLVPRSGDDGADFAGPQLAAVLDQQLISSQQEDADTRILLSFRNKDGVLCRAYSSETASGIACREQPGWRVVNELDGSGSASSKYRQAGSGDAALLAIAQDMAEGPALDSEQEAAAKEAGWR